MLSIFMIYDEILVIFPFFNIINLLFNMRITLDGMSGCANESADFRLNDREALSLTMRMAFHNSD